MTDEKDDAVLGAGKYLRLRRRNRWEFVERPGITEVAVIIAITKDNEAVFVEQHREPVAASMIEWAAGLVGDEEGDDGEPLLDAANRELQEETGFRANQLSVLAQGPPSGGLASEIITFVRAEGIERVSAGGGVGHEEIKVHPCAALRRQCLAEGEIQRRPLDRSEGLRRAVFPGTSRQRWLGEANSSETVRLSGVGVCYPPNFLRRRRCSSNHSTRSMTSSTSIFGSSTSCCREAQWLARETSSPVRNTSAVAKTAGRRASVLIEG